MHIVQNFKKYIVEISVFSCSLFSLLIGSHSKPVSCVPSQRYSIHLQIFMCVFFFSANSSMLCKLCHTFFYLIFSFSWIFLDFVLPSTYNASYVYLYTIPMLNVAEQTFELFTVFCYYKWYEYLCISNLFFCDFV